MALTPEDVINKRFQPTKFREGYDQDEVDDFLDEIVVELRRLNQENADLRAQAEAAPAAAAQGSSPAQPATRASVSEQAPAADYTDSAQSAAGVLAMAQQLHDQYVGEGRAERERLIAEGRAQADTLVADAETSKAEVLSSLEDERRGLEDAVSGLRSFETSYRERLTAFIDGQLQEIRTAPSLAPEDADGSSAERR